MDRRVRVGPFLPRQVSRAGLFSVVGQRESRLGGAKRDQRHLVVQRQSALLVVDQLQQIVGASWRQGEAAPQIGGEVPTL